MPTQPEVAPTNALVPDTDVVAGHRDGLGSHRWGDPVDEVADYVTQRLGHGPNTIEAQDSTTGYRQLAWSGFMLDADPDGGLVQWYWYPSFSDGVVVDELGDYQGGLGFARRPNGTEVQTIGPEPNLWWVGSNLSVRYAWDALGQPPQVVGDVVGAVIYVTARKEPSIASGQPGVVPAGTDVLMFPNGARLYTLEAQTSVVIYGLETHDEQSWALVVPPTDGAIAGYVVWPPAGT